MVILPFGRTVSRQFVSQRSRVLTRLTNTPPLLHVSCTYKTTSRPLQAYSNPLVPTAYAKTYRTYATEATLRPVGRPKGHTGLAAAKKSTTKKTNTKKPGTKTATGKKNVGRKKKAAKPKPKPKPKPKKEPSVRTLERAASMKRKELKEKALLHPPKKLPQTVWAIIFSESKQKGISIAEGGASTKEAAEKLKNLSPEEHENYNKIATANKVKNETEYKKWLSGFTPEQIREANLARQALAREDKEKNSKKSKNPKYANIKDERTVKRPTPPYTSFTAERFKSGDFRNMTVPESAKLIGREWKALSDAAKQPYYDQYKADSNRYVEEFKTVYGKDAPVVAAHAKAASAA